MGGIVMKQKKGNVSRGKILASAAVIAVIGLLFGVAMQGLLKDALGIPIQHYHLYDRLSNVRRMLMAPLCDRFQQMYGISRNISGLSSSIRPF